MQSNIERVTNIIRTLPFEDLEKLGKVIDEEKRAKRAKNIEGEKQLDDYAKAKKWIAENGEKYMNQWVCLEGDKLVAHGEDGRKVYRKAKEAGIKAPFIKRIIEEPEAFVGGWS